MSRQMLKQTRLTDPCLPSKSEESASLLARNAARVHRESKSSRGVEALSVLRGFLSEAADSSAPTRRHSGATIKRLYEVAKAASVHSRLSSAELSSLIGLFGVLSLPASESPNVYSKDLPAYLEETSPRRLYWGYVMDVAGDKEKMGRTLSNSDRYWIMRARLAHLNGASPSRKWYSMLD